MCTSWSRTVLAALLTALLLFSPVTSPWVQAGEGDASDAYRAALRAEATGNVAAAQVAYERVLVLDPEHLAARRALGFEEIDGYWLRGDELRRAQGFVHHAGHWMTALEFADATRPERATREQKAGEGKALACLALVAGDDPSRARAGKRRLATLPARYRLAPLAQALRCEPPTLRVYAAGALAQLADPLAVPALLKRVVDDPDDAVRQAAADALRTIGASGTIHALGRALWSRDATRRVRAAEALGRIGDGSAAPYLIARWEKRSGAFPRAFFAQVDQFSYLQDFDVEVAATSFIADPIVGVLQEGILQDVRIHATEHTFSTVERVAYAGALRQISGVDHGRDVAAWRRWVDGANP